LFANVPNAPSPPTHIRCRTGAASGSVSREKGWRPNTFEPGDVVEFKLFPMRDGSNAALFVGAKFSNGETLGNW